MKREETFADLVSRVPSAIAAGSTRDTMSSKLVPESHFCGEMLPLLLIACGIVVGGCGAPSGEAETPTVTGRPSASAASSASIEQPPPKGDLVNAGWSLVEVPHLSLAVPLPDRSRWSVTLDGDWFRAVHDGSDSTLQTRLWRAARMVRRAECTEQLRLWVPDAPDPASETVVERRRVTVSELLETEIVVGVNPDNDGLVGWALAIGAAPRRCFAALFLTRASGALMAEDIAQRLGLVVAQVIPRIEVRRIEQRIDPEHR